MPLALSLVPIDRQFDGYRSVMFVACNVCPRMHVAWQHRGLAPIDFRRGQRPAIA